MDNWRRECAGLRVSADETELYRAAEDMAISLGFDALVFALLIPTSVNRPLFKVFGVDFNGQDKVDARVLQRIMRGNPAGGHWSTHNARKAAPWLNFLPVDYLYGWSQPTRGTGLDTGLASFARASGPLTGDEVNALELRMIHLSQTLHCHMMTLATAEDKLYEELTADEVAVLRWAADGKTADEIAGILGLQARSVNYIASLARMKLRTSTTIQAVTRAQGLGLL